MTVDGKVYLTNIEQNIQKIVFYRSPEAVTMQKLDEKSDMWAIGVIAYILLTGRPPFDSNSVVEIKSKIIAGRFAIDSDEMVISKEARQFVKELLVVAPSRRLGASGSLRHAWMQIDTSRHD